VMHHDQTAEALAVREQRRARCLQQPVDILAERARVMAYWRSMAPYWAQSGYRRPATCAPFFGGLPAHRRLAMPGVRAMLDARQRAHRERIAAETRDFDRRRRGEKAAKARATEPQTELF